MNWSAAIGLALVIAAPGLKDPPKKGPSLVGEWSCASIAFGGAVVANPGQTFEFTPDGKVHNRKPGPDGFIKVGQYKADPGKDPAEFEWSLGLGAPTCLGI